MITVKDDSIFNRCIETWGEDAQLDMVTEECLELLLELHRRKRNRHDVEKICEETADVWIMLQQLVNIVGEHNIQKIVYMKETRLKDRLKEANWGYGEK